MCGKYNINLSGNCKSVNFHPRLCIKEEAAGKVRVFVQVDSLMQTLLKLLHLYLFNILKIILNEGTFDQDASVKRAEGKLR